MFFYLYFVTVLPLSVSVTRFLLLIFSCATGPLYLCIPAFNIKMHIGVSDIQRNLVVLSHSHEKHLKYTHLIRKSTQSGGYLPTHTTLTYCRCMHTRIQAKAHTHTHTRAHADQVSVCLCSPAHTHKHTGLSAWRVR